MLKKLIIFILFFSFCSSYNSEILIINCPTKVYTSRNYHNLKYRIIAGRADIISIEEKIYKNGEFLSSTKESSNNPPTIQKLTAKEFIINLNEETGLNSYVVEINIVDENENYLSDSCDIVFDLS
tara:strand:+ start:1921 stop:2295 length:375 start_codon:yes stop_codon:yes gene_type:complete